MLKELYTKRYDENPDDFWLFEDIMEYERGLGVSSTFFFASIFRFDFGANKYDVPYILKQDRFKQIFKKIRKKGFDIGLHASYNAYKSPNKFIYEKKKLEEVSGAEVKGQRHHYWHMGIDEGRTLKYHELAGLGYDSSIAFNDIMGFKRNIALPYYPVNHEGIVKVLQLPVFCMDGNLFYSDTTIEAVLKKLQQFNDILKRNNGLGVIDWHVRTSYPKNREYRNWGETYVKYIENVTRDDTAWVTNLMEIHNWVMRRRLELNYHPGTV
jgi:hypothetical protein